MTLLLIFLIFIFGLLIGSFLNVLIFRVSGGKIFSAGGFLKSGKGKTFRRSYCFSCGKILRWFDLMPVFSFLFLKGRCRFCKSRISKQYPLVELTNGFLWLSAYLKFQLDLDSSLISWFSVFILGFLLSVLWFVFVYDLKHKIIGDKSTILIFTLVFLLWFSEAGWSVDFGILKNLFFGALASFSLFSLWAVSKGRWLGFGDVKLVFPLGFWAGSLWLSGLILAFWLGAIYSLLAMGIFKIFYLFKVFKIEDGLTMKSQVPFAPFLVLAFALIYFFKIDIFGLFEIFFE